MSTEHDKAVAAAREFLQSPAVLDAKAALVGAIGTSIDDHAAALAAATEAAAAAEAADKRVSDAYAAALAGGWTADQLEALGYKPRRARRGRPPRRSGTTRRATRTPGPTTDDTTTPPGHSDENTGPDHHPQ